MGFMAGFGSAFAESYDKQKDREFQHQEDDFRLQMESYLKRQDELLQVNRENYKAVQTAKAAAAQLGHPEYWSTLYPGAKGGASVEQLVTMGQNTVFSPSSKTSSSSNTPADSSQDLTHQAQSATDAQMQQSGMTPPPSGGVFSTNPPPPNTGQDQSAQHLRETPDTSNNVNAPAAPMGATGSNSNPVQTIGSSGPQAPNLPQNAPTPTPSPNDPVTAQQDRPTNTGAQDNNPTPPMPVPGVKNQAQQGGNVPPPQPDQSFNPPSPNLSAVPSRPGEFPVNNFPGSEANRQRIMQDVGGQDQYNKVMGSDLITGSPIPGLGDVQVNMRPRGVMKWQDVKNLNDAQAYYRGVTSDPDLKDEIPRARQMVDTYMQQRLDEARMQGIANGTWRVPTRAAIKDDQGNYTGGYAFSTTDDTGQDVAKDQNGIQIWKDQNGQRVPLKNLRVFGKDVEDQLATDTKAGADTKAAYDNDKNLLLSTVRTAAAMQKTANAYPQALGASGDIAQAGYNFKREVFNILSLVHPNLDPESDVPLDDSTMGSVGQIEKNLMSKLGSTNTKANQVAIAANLLDAQTIRLAYQEAKMMNEAQGRSGQRISQEQFMGIYQALRKGESPVSLGMSNADFLTSKLSTLQDQENEMTGPGSANDAFQKRFGFQSPLTFGKSISDTIDQDPELKSGMDYFKNLKNNNPIMQNGQAVPLGQQVIDKSKQFLGMTPPAQPQAAAPSSSAGFAGHPNQVSPTPQGHDMGGVSQAQANAVTEVPKGVAAKYPNLTIDAWRRLLVNGQYQTVLKAVQGNQ